MSQNFYELLRISPKASREDIQNAYRLRTAHLVRRLRNAEEKGADTSLLHKEQQQLTQAKDILLDAEKRKSYDLFRNCCENGFPDDIDQLWNITRSSMVSNKQVASLHVLQQFTQLPIDNLSIIERKKPYKMTEATTTPKIAVVAQASRPAAKKLPPRTPPPKKSNLLNMQPAELAKKIGYGGKFIKAIRESRGIKLESLAKSTCISINFLMAIENNAFEQLPSTTFVKGYVIAIAETLGIDQLPIVEEYMQLYNTNR